MIIFYIINWCYYKHYSQSAPQVLPFCVKMVSLIFVCCKIALNFQILKKNYSQVLPVLPKSREIQLAGCKQPVIGRNRVGALGWQVLP